MICLVLKTIEKEMKHPEAVTMKCVWFYGLFGSFFFYYSLKLLRVQQLLQKLFP